mgnify:CR=1 FL=1
MSRKTKGRMIGAVVFAVFYVPMYFLAGFPEDPWNNVRIPLFTMGVLVGSAIADALAAEFTRERR